MYIYSSDLVSRTLFLRRVKFFYLFILFWLIALILYTVYLYLTQIKNNDTVRIKDINQQKDVNQAEIIIEKLYQLKSLVDNHVISVQEYVVTKQRILSSLSPSQQTSASPQYDNYWINTRSIQSNIAASHHPQCFQPSTPMNQNTQKFRPDISGNQYYRSTQPEPYNSQVCQFPNLIGINPYQNSKKAPYDNHEIHNNNQDFSSLKK